MNPEKSPLRYLLDTSVYSQRLRKNPVPGVVSRWRALGDRTLAASIICEAELLFGLHKADSKRLWLEYENYLKDRITILPVSSKEAETFAEIKTQLVSQGIPKSDFDILIAATAKAHGLILATLNVKDFAPLPGVAVEDWGV